MTQEVLIVSDTESLVIESTDQEVFEIGIQGPPGLSGAAVAGGFLIVNRFSEIAVNETAKAQARTNLDLQNIDGGTFN